MRGASPWLLVAAALSAAVSARAAGKAYDEIRPLIGTWDAIKDCPEGKERFVLAFKEEKDRVSGRIFDGDVPARELGRFDIVYNRSQGHYRYSLALPDNPILKALSLDPLPGALVVSDDEDDPDSPGKDYLSIGSIAGPLKASATAKLRDRRRTATFVFKSESPMGKTACRGSATKRKTKPAPR